MVVRSHVDALFEVYLVGRRFRNSIKQENTDTMLTVAILRFLHTQPVTVTQLGLHVSMKPSAMSEKITDLVTAGLVSKRTPEDGREIIIEITEAGKKELHRIYTVLKIKSDEIFKQFSEDDIETFVQLFHTLSIPI